MTIYLTGFKWSKVFFHLFILQEFHSRHGVDAVSPGPLLWRRRKEKGKKGKKRKNSNTEKWSVPYLNHAFYKEAHFYFFASFTLVGTKCESWATVQWDQCGILTVTCTIRVSNISQVISSFSNFVCQALKQSPVHFFWADVASFKTEPKSDSLADRLLTMKHCWF